MAKRRCKAKVDKAELNPHLIVNLCMECSEDVDEWIRCNLDKLSRVYALISLRKFLLEGTPFPPTSHFEKFCRSTHAHCREQYLEMTATRH